MALSGLIEALNIFLKYGNPKHPTHCEHDVMFVLVDPAKIADEDKIRLEELGFIASPNDERVGSCFKSFQYGSA